MLCYSNGTDKKSFTKQPIDQSISQSIKATTAVLQC